MLAQYVYIQNAVAARRSEKTFNRVTGTLPS